MSAAPPPPVKPVVHKQMAQRMTFPRAHAAPYSPSSVKPQATPEFIFRQAHCASPPVSSRPVSSTLASAVPLGGSSITRSPQSRSRETLATGPSDSPKMKHRMLSSGSILPAGLTHEKIATAGQLLSNSPPKVNVKDGNAASSPDSSHRRRSTLPTTTINVFRPEHLPSQSSSDSSQKKHFHTSPRSPSPLELRLEETSKKGQPYQMRHTPSAPSLICAEPLTEDKLSTASGTSSLQHATLRSSQSSRSLQHSSSLRSTLSPLPEWRTLQLPSAGAPHCKSSGVASSLRSSASSWKPQLKSQNSSGASEWSSPRSLYSQDSAILRGIFQEQSPFTRSRPRLSGSPHQDSSSVKAALTTHSSSLADTSERRAGTMSPVSSGDGGSRATEISRRQRSLDLFESNVRPCLSPALRSEADTSEQPGSLRAGQSDRGNKSPNPDAGHAPDSERASGKGRRESPQRSVSPWATDMDFVNVQTSVDLQPSALVQSPDKVDLKDLQPSALVQSPNKVDLNEVKLIRRRPSPQGDDRTFAVDINPAAVPRRGRQSPRAQMERLKHSPPPWASHIQPAWADDEVCFRSHTTPQNPAALAPRDKEERSDADPLLEAKIMVARADAKVKSPPSAHRKTPPSRHRSPRKGTPRSSSGQRHELAWLEKVHSRLEGAILHAESLGPGTRDKHSEAAKLNDSGSRQKEKSSDASNSAHPDRSAGPSTTCPDLRGESNENGSQLLSLSPSREVIWSGSSRFANLDSPSGERPVLKEPGSAQGSESLFAGDCLTNDQAEGASSASSCSPYQSTRMSLNEFGGSHASDGGAANSRSCSPMDDGLAQLARRLGRQPSALVEPGQEDLQNFWEGKPPPRTVQRPRRGHRKRRRRRRSFASFHCCP